MADVEKQADYRIIDLPVEVLQIIISYLSRARDIYHLMQTCKLFHALLLRQLYEYDAKKSRKSMTWAFDKQRLDTVRRAIDLGIDMFQFSHVQKAVAANDCDILQAVLNSPGVKPAWESRSGRQCQLNGEPLFYAVTIGNTDMARLLLGHGADPFSHYRIGFFPSILEMKQEYLRCIINEGQNWSTIRQAISAFVQAACLGRCDMIRLFISHAGNKPVTTFNEGLETAARYGQSDVVKLLLDAGCDANHSDFEHRSLLHLTSISGCTETFQLLLSRGAVLDHRKSQKGFTLLHVAGSADMVRLLLQKGFPADILSDDSHDIPCTPLILACERAEEAVAIALLDAGASPHAVTSKGLSALDCAVLSGHARLVKRLAEMGVSIQTKTGGQSETPLHRAIQRQNLQVIQILLELGADMYAMAKYRRPIDEAAVASQDILALFVEHGADLDSTWPDGDAAVHSLINSAHKHKHDVLNRLAHFGADMNAKDHKGDCPIHIAARLNDSSTVGCLLKLRVDANSKDGRGWTALMVACQKQYCYITSALIRHGADANCRVGDVADGQTALDIVLSLKKFQSLIVTSLLKAGATVDVNSASYSPKTQRILKSCIEECS